MILILSGVSQSKRGMREDRLSLSPKDKWKKLNSQMINLSQMIKATVVRSI